MQEQEKIDALSKIARQLINIIVFLVVIILFLSGWIVYSGLEKKNQPNKTPSSPSTAAMQTTAAAASPATDFWQAPDISSLPENAEKEILLYGKELITNTALFFGPNGKISKNRTNGMSCQNCHLAAGTKVYGNNYGSVFSTYPKYRARSGAEEDISKRVNDCFERSLNGKALAVNSREMKAITSYINWLGKDVPKGEKAKGSGFKDIPFLDRAANSLNGKMIYAQKCQSCHQANGEGVLNADKTAFTYPPLWGKNSYNDGAGLYRISNLAKYVKSNMPLGASHDNSILTDEEAWDLAAYINSQPRPSMNIKKDWPKTEEKPIDHPFGPFVDGFSAEQHKYGPFQPIKEKLDALKKEKIKS
ncbi:MAG: c-type cytochrome [Sphingobacteriales bacterium]|jgi:thiosulfate dehydrogenase|nr:c-type cytochrome [Sphingobacteriales bacterium]